MNFLAPNEVQLSTTSLLFENSITELCASVSVEDNDSMEGSRSYQLVLQRNGASTVPVELYPNALIIIIIDNDGPGKHYFYSYFVSINIYKNDEML